MDQKIVRIKQIIGFGCIATSLLGCASAPLQAAEPLLKSDPAAPLMLQPKLLDAAVAFKFAARLKDAQTIEVRYQIAPGYYAYKDKFRATVRAAEQANLTALDPVMPAGTVTDDPGFGRVETYRQVVFFTVPLSEAVTNAGLQLTLNAQGCADVGVCYAPQRYSLTLTAVGDFASPRVNSGGIGG
jgi:thioredoxin:protein disulfide reductase